MAWICIYFLYGSKMEAIKDKIKIDWILIWQFGEKEWRQIKILSKDLYLRLRQL
jgi:hypothetical protein